ncbi:TPA: subtilase cytotoxin subunit B [Escherichia coli]|nr:subtilase cytotoxin subunit B [Escherichia coli]HBA7678154.1 subtilase cytotoxin subunit B [Escherichia coli]HBA7682922.1 subtilase cytotoxin subunit B [Escherichia coli]HBA7692445.1 subtilase cytotoxin subunit B [Escherichia coli]
MKKTISLVLIIIGLLCNSARAEWTGDRVNNFYSNAVITDMHVGQIDSSQYFCIKAQLKNNNTISACSIQKQSKWGHAFDALFSQAKLFYSTGQRVRLYVQPNVWTYSQFYNVFSRNALVGLSSCASESTCFGPAYE